MELGSLARAVEALEVPLERAALVDLGRVRDALDAKYLAALGAYEAAGSHEVDGHRTMKAWLRAECGADRPSPRPGRRGPASSTGSPT